MVKRWLLLILILILSMPVWAKPLSLKVTVSNQVPAAIGPGKFIEVIQGSCVTSPRTSNYLAPGSGTIRTDERPTTNTSSYVSATTTGPNQFLSQGSGVARLRIWNGATAREVIDSKGYYGYFNYDLGAETDAPDEKTGTASTNLKADVPARPSIGGVSVTYTERDGDLWGNASVLITVPGGFEYADAGSGAYRIMLRRKGVVNWEGAPVYRSSTPTVGTGPNLDMGVTFEVTAQTSSWFGDSEWSAVAEFKTAGLAAGGAAGPITYSLVKAPGGIGLNAISIVHEVPFKVEGVAVTKVKDLVDAINTKAGSKIVFTIGWLEGNNIKGYFVTYDASGNAVFAPAGGITPAEETDLLRGTKPLQIGVINETPVEVTFSQ